MDNNNNNDNNNNTNSNNNSSSNNNNNFDPNLSITSMLRDLENANRRDEFLAQQYASHMFQQRQQSIFNPMPMNNPMNASLGARAFRPGPFFPQALHPLFGQQDFLRQQQQQRQLQMQQHQQSQQQLQALPPQYRSSMAKPIDMVDLSDSPPPPPAPPPPSDPIPEPDPIAAAVPKSVVTKEEPFPWRMFCALNDEQYPDALRWSKDGKAFHVNYGNPKIMDILEKYFKTERTFGRWLSELSSYGWWKLTEGKHKGLMYNQHFHRNMTQEDYDRIIQYKKKSPKAKKVIRANAEKSSEAMEAKKDRTKPTPKDKEKTKATGKRKEIESPGATEKSRKKRNLTAEHAKKPPPPKDKLQLLRTGLRQHKKFHDMFWKWDVWNYPTGLYASLEYQRRLSYMVFEDKKVKSYLITKKRRKQSRNTDDKPLAEEELPTNKEAYAHLLCDEELPESLFEKDEEQALSEFVERIRKDKIKQDKLKEIWSNIEIPVVKGKVLPPEKFAKPTDEWKKLQVGDKIGVWWQKDSMYYTANIQKQQEKTSYFQLVYDDDGAEEWLDLSRQKFKILDDSMKPVRKDKPARKIEESGDGTIQLPEKYSHLSPFVRYSWDQLGLGSKAGTPAYNSYIREIDPSAPEATALDLLNDLRKLRSKGFSGIPLQIDKDGNDDEVTNQLRDLQDKISKNKDAASSIQEFNRALAAVRKLTDTWSIPAVKKNLQTIQTQILKLNQEEARILEKCKQKGIC